MRVIAGVLGGRRLRAPPGRTTRPTSDRVREALFSTLGDHVIGASVLDLFAGSGALGIEALSRGAAAATFVERQRAAARTLRDNLRTLDLDATVYVGDAARFVRDAAAVGHAGPYDVTLCDPPYDLADNLLARLLRQLAHAGGLTPDASVIVERAARSEPFPAEAAGLTVLDRRRYGDTVLYYLRHGDAQRGRDGNR